MKPLPLALVVLFLPSGLDAAAQQPGYYRFPALHGESIVFTAEGDLWRVPVTGGTARRITTHAGTESHAAISADGRWLAFSAQYEGPTEVFVMPLDGGLPRRLTWDGEGSFVAGWTPDSNVIFSTKSQSALPNDQLVEIGVDGSRPQLFPLAQASEGVLSDDRRMLFFTRLPFQGSSTKRYKGGTAQNLWRFDIGAPEAVPLTADYAGTSKNPMWHHGRVFFLSDRSGIVNLWSMKSDGADLKQLTNHRDFDAKSASLHGGRIVYQHGADLRLFGIEGATDTLVPITLASDFDHTREKWVQKPSEFVTDVHLSPDGDRVILTARGGVFIAPAESGGRLIELPRRAGARHRAATFLPDGRHLLSLSDESGEWEFWRQPANGLGESDRLTTDGKIFRFAGVPSPDGKWIASHDKNRELWIIDIAKKQPARVAQSLEDEFDDLAWSPDGQWLAYVDTAPNTYQQIKFFRPADGARVTVTSDRVNSFAPAWSPDGKWLYFLSERALRSAVESPWGPRQPEPHFNEVTRIYALALSREARFPFQPADELHPPPPETKPRAAGPQESPPGSPAPGGEPKPAEPAPRPGVTIDLDGLTERLFEVPVDAGNYSGLAVGGKHLFFTSRPPGFESKPRLLRLEVTHRDPKPKMLVESIKSWELSADTKRLLVALEKPDRLFVIASDAADTPAKLEKPVPLEGWTFTIDPREEWRQIFIEAWRMLRDFFYDTGMHGVDWPAIRRKYEALVPRLADRGDLNDLLHEMSGELSALHIYVRHGDFREGPDDIKPASLGARLVADPASGGWRVDHVFTSDPDYPGELSPLARPGVGVRAGDVIVSINGTRTTAEVPPDRLLRGRAGSQVLLEVRSPNAADSRLVIVKPLTLEQAQDLRYDQWEYTRRLEVEKLGRGHIGYVHLRAMGAANIAEWAREFYPVFNRQGLIIDVRHNRGGNIDSWLLEKLLRKAWFYWSRRVGTPYWSMQYAFRGHVCVLCNERTASDGEAFSEGFRRLGLGKLIGTRTWGGEIWLNARRWLVDNGMTTAAESGVYGPEGAWLIEGHGVDPDIVVDNLPHATFNNHDAQLEAAVKHLDELIAKDPRPVPPAPPRPDKSFRPSAPESPPQPQEKPPR